MASVVLPPCPRHSRHAALLPAPPVSPLRVFLTSTPPRNPARVSLCCLRCTATRQPHTHDLRRGTNAAARGPLRAATSGCGGEHEGWMARLAAAERAGHTRGGPRGPTRRLALGPGSSGTRRPPGFTLHPAHRLRARCRLHAAVGALPPRAPLTARLRRTALGRPSPQWRRCALGVAAASMRADLLAQAWRAQGSAQAQAVGADGGILNGQGIGFWRADDAGAAGWRGGGDEVRDEQRAGWQAEGQAGAAEAEESEAEKEKRRRGRISEANKGKVPWNKGRQWSAGACALRAGARTSCAASIPPHVHSHLSLPSALRLSPALPLYHAKVRPRFPLVSFPEVRAKIRERTKQAMSNPEVRERLRDHGHTQSAETRSLIRERMRAAWQRKKQERLTALALLAEWQGELAAAARVGLAGDRELVRCGNGRVVYADEVLARASAKRERRTPRTSAPPRERGEGGSAAAGKGRGDGGTSGGEGEETAWGEGEGSGGSSEKRVAVRRGGQSEEHRRRISEAIKAKWADPAYRSNVARGMKSVQRTPSSADPTSPAPAPAAAPRATRARRAVRVGERERRETAKETAAGGQEAEGGGEGGEGAAGRGAAVVVQQADEAFVQAVMAAESAQAEGAQGAQGAAQGAEQAQGDGGGMRFKRVLIVRQAGGSAGEEEAQGVGGEERVEESTGVAVRVGLLGEGGLQGGEEGKGEEEREVEEEGVEGGEEEEVESDMEDMKTLAEAGGESGWRFSAGEHRQAKGASGSDGGAGQGGVSGGLHGGEGTGNGAVRQHHAPPSAAPLPSLLPLSPTTNQRRLARQLIARRRRQLAERARVLMQEAQSAAQSLEALAARDATAMASLLETRRLLDQAGRAVARAERTTALPLTPKGVPGGVPAHRVPGGDWRSGLSGSGSGTAAWTHAGATPGCGGDGGQARAQVRGAESEAMRGEGGNGAVHSAVHGADGEAASARVVGSMGGVPGSAEAGSGEERQQELRRAESGAGEREAVVVTPPGGGAGPMNGRTGQWGSEGEQGMLLYPLLTCQQDHPNPFHRCSPIACCPPRLSPASWLSAPCQPLAAACCRCRTALQACPQEESGRGEELSEGADAGADANREGHDAG
ncbi:unnamed protein product [Closterium sp. NIES-53]